MKKGVSKSTIKRIENTDENQELNSMKLSLELAGEADDETFKELIMLHRDDMKILNSEDEDTIKRDFDRMSRGI